MIRSPQAFLVSLSLHILIGVAILFFVVPKMVSPSVPEMHRCSISLSHVVPAFPAVSEPRKARMVPMVSAQTRSSAKEEAKPVTHFVAKEHESVPVTEAVPLPVGDTAAESKSMQALMTAETMESPIAEKAENDKPLLSETVEAVAGETAEKSPVTQAKQDREHYMSEHMAVIAKLLQENLYYPRMARKRHIEGEVLAAFTIETDGTVGNVALKKHARPVLDRAAVQTIESLSGLLPHPEAALTIEVPIRFVLN